MCDYSLMMIPNRLASEGDQLIAHRFNSGTTGLVSLLDFSKWQTDRPVRFWQRLRDCFVLPTEPSPVVCIPPGARLRIRDIPGDLRKRFGLNACEDAAFTQKSAETWQHRDILLFGNGSEVLLQLLEEGQRVSILSVSSEESVAPAPAEPAHAV